MADYSQTAASVLASQYAKRFQINPSINASPSTVTIPKAGATITAGMPVYQGTDDLIYPADANGASPLYKVVGIAENNASAGQPVSIVEEDPQFTPGCTLAVGDIVIVSATAGKIAPHTDIAAGMFVASMGIAYSTTQMSLKIVRSDAVRV